MKAMLTTAIQFSDGTPVIETLEIIKSKVARVLEAFKPHFERARVGDAYSAPHSASPIDSPQHVVFVVSTT